jgi:hypothetical protein
MPLIPIDPQLVTHFNRSIMRLLRPAHLRDESYVTDFYCGTEEHPDGVTWPLLYLPDEEEVPVHIEADGEELKQLLDIFVLDGAITAEEADGIKAAISAVRGQKVRVADFIPPSWAGRVMTREQAEAAGYFVEQAE